MLVSYNKPRIYSCIGYKINYKTTPGVWMEANILLELPVHASNLEESR